MSYMPMKLDISPTRFLAIAIRTFFLLLQRCCILAFGILAWTEWTNNVGLCVAILDTRISEILQHNILLSVTLSPSYDFDDANCNRKTR
jgi:uncharacterized membrane protein YGL010W